MGTSEAVSDMRSPTPRPTARPARSMWATDTVLVLERVESALPAADRSAGGSSLHVPIGLRSTWRLPLGDCFAIVVGETRLAWRV